MLCLALRCPLALCSSLAQPQSPPRGWALLLPFPACPVPPLGKEVTHWVLVTLAPAGGHREEGKDPDTSVSGGACVGRHGSSHLDFIVLFLFLIGILEGIAVAPWGTTVASLQAGELGLLLLSLAPAGLGRPALPGHL